MRDITICVLPEFGNAYYVTLAVDDRFDVEEQINEWMDDNLINVQDWEFN